MAKTDSPRKCAICNRDHNTNKHTDYVIRALENLEVPIKYFYALDDAIKELRRLNEITKG